MDQKDQTHDFMNVESFSQLPFIRPAPSPKDKGGIRLFGIEFSGGNVAPVASAGETESALADPEADESSKETESPSESGRKFECHYCCRNFPTSQALGGHQNAHKRERQHAKRAHLQSAFLHGDAAAHHHVYGSLINYHPNRIGLMPPTPAASGLHYTSWNTTTNAVNNHNKFYYTGHNNTPPSFSASMPITGSPLTSWRNPTIQSGHNATIMMMTNRDRTLNNLPLFGGDNPKTAGGGTVLQCKNSAQDHVSLDLHL